MKTSAQPLKDLGVRVRNLRRRLKLTQAQLAKDLGLEQASISRWETGERTPDLRHIMRLSERLGTTIETLVSGGSK